MAERAGGVERDSWGRNCAEAEKLAELGVSSVARISRVMAGLSVERRREREKVLVSPLLTVPSCVSAAPVLTYTLAVEQGEVTEKEAGRDFSVRQASPVILRVSPEAASVSAILTEVMDGVPSHLMMVGCSAGVAGVAKVREAVLVMMMVISSGSADSAGRVVAHIDDAHIDEQQSESCEHELPSGVQESCEDDENVSVEEGVVVSVVSSGWEKVTAVVRVMTISSPV